MSLLVHALAMSQHQYVVAQVVLGTHLSDPRATTLQHGHVCLYACHIQVALRVSLAAPVHLPAMS